MPVAPWKPADTVLNYRVSSEGHLRWRWEVFAEDDPTILEHGLFLGSKAGAIATAIGATRSLSAKMLSRFTQSDVAN